MSMPVVAIDGPAGAGKSTVAKMVAAELGYTYLDSGAMYRAVAVTAVARDVDTSDPVALTRMAQDMAICFQHSDSANRILVDGVDLTTAIRTPDASRLSSVVSAVPGVRRAMVQIQRSMAATGGAVMEGRDIGTVVFPDAAVKIYLTASAEERARRRTAELVAKGIKADVKAVEAEIIERDLRDSTRADSPLCAAADAVLVDTDGMSIRQVVEAIVDICRTKAGAECRT